MKRIERENGIGLEDNVDDSDPRKKLNILDVFGIEINSWIIL